MTRAARARAGVALGLILLAPALMLGASAQVLRNPTDAAFHESFSVTGRIVDKDGWPVNQFFLDVAIEGVTGVKVETQRVGTNCNGDFGAFFDLRTIRGKDATVTVSVHDQQFFHVDEKQRLTQTQPLDKFFRLNQFVFVLPRSWPSECGRTGDYWPGRVTVAGRFVDGVKDYEMNGTKDLLSKPVAYWPMGLNVTLDTGGRFPPDSVIPTDERGDFQYSWTFVKTVKSANATVEAKGVRVEAPVDPLARVAFVKIFTGEHRNDTPASPAALALAAVAAVALALARRGRRDA